MYVHISVTSYDFLTDSIHIVSGLQFMQQYVASASFHHSFLSIHSFLLGWFASVLVLWPVRYDVAVRFSSANIDKACEVIESFTSDTPQAERSSFVEFVLSRGSQHPATIGRTISQAALAWKDSASWTRAVIAASRESGCNMFPSHEPLWDAALAFGFDKICPGYVR